MRTVNRLLAATPPWLLCCAPGLFLFVVSLFALDRVPYFGGDEVWPASTAMTFANEGRFAREVTRGSLGTEVFDAFPPVWILSLSAVFKLFGVGVWTTRVPALLAVSAAVVLLATVVYRITESKAHAGLAAMLWALDPVLLQRGRIGRSEPFAIMFFTAGLTLVLGSRRRPWAWLLGGLCFALGVGSYQFAGVAVFAALVGLLVNREYRRLLWCGAGGALGLALWAAWLWGRFEYFQEQVVTMGQHYNLPVWQAIVAEWQRYSTLAGVNAPIAILVFMLSPLAAVLTWREAKCVEERVLSAASLTAFALLAVVGMKSFVYFIFLSPFAYFCLATCVLRVRWKLAWPALAALSAAGGAMIIGGIWYKAGREWSCRDSTRFSSAVAPYIKSGDFVVGPTALWLPTVQRGARFRLTTQGFGPETVPYQNAFLADAEALSRASLIALDPTAGAALLERYPVLQKELEGRSKVFELDAAGCGPSMFAVQLYAPSTKLKSEASGHRTKVRLDTAHGAGPLP